MIFHCYVSSPEGTTSYKCPIVGIFMYQLLVNSEAAHLAGAPGAVRHFSSQQCSTTCAELRMDGWRVPGLRRQWLPLYVSGIFWYRNGGFLKWGYPKIIHFNRIFHCKPSIWGYPSLWNPQIGTIWVYL